MFRSTSRLFVGAIVTTLFAGLLAVIALTPAEAASVTRCDPRSGTSSGICWTRSTVSKRLKVVEAIPLENRTKKTRTMNCSFTRTVTRTFEGGGSLTTSAKASILKLVDVGTELTLHASVSQSGAQASAAGAQVNVGPGKRVICERTYGYVVSRIKETRYTGVKSSSRTFEVKIPAYLGLRLVD